MRFNHHRTITGLFTTPFSQLLEGDGRVRPTIYTLGTNTGRMSCVRPNLQQMSKQGGIRAMVTASPGHVLVSADFSSVEVRVAAALSQDPVLAQFIADGRDLHAEVALQAFGPNDEASAVSEDNPEGKPKPSKKHRYQAKSGVFGFIYGGGISTLAKQVGVSEQTMAVIIDSLKTITPTLTQWSAWVKGQSESGNRQFPSCSGRIIHFPPRQSHAAGNYAIQGTARELLVDALLRLRETRWGQVVTLPVHDELILEVPEADGAAATAELVRCMETSLYGIPISASPSAPAFAWQDAA
jgi:DNA polymerase I-like protein with 3'-5' exonuclease and polymerase domains